MIMMIIMIIIIIIVDIIKIIYIVAIIILIPLPILSKARVRGPTLQTNRFTFLACPLPFPSPLTANHSHCIIASMNIEHCSHDFQHYLSQFVAANVWGTNQHHRAFPENVQNNLRNLPRL